MQYDCRLRFFLADPSAWPDGMASDMFLLVPLAFMRACAPWSCLGGVNSKQERAAGCRRPQMAMGMSASPVGHAQPQMAWHIHLHKGMNQGQVVNTICLSLRFSWSAVTFLHVDSKSRPVQTYLSSREHFKMKDIIVHAYILATTIRIFQITVHWIHFPIGISL